MGVISVEAAAEAEATVGVKAEEETDTFGGARGRDVDATSPRATTLGDDADVNGVDSGLVARAVWLCDTVVLRFGSAATGLAPSCDRLKAASVASSAPPCFVVALLVVTDAGAALFSATADADAGIAVSASRLTAAGGASLLSYVV